MERYPSDRLDPTSDRQEDVDELFASFGESESGVEPSLGNEAGQEGLGEHALRQPLQFRLRALFTALLLTGLFSIAYLYQRAFGFLLFFALATAMASRAQRKRERIIASMFFGGAAGLCGGLMLAESGRPSLAISGLVIACLGGYASLHSVGLIIASYWE